MARSWRARIVVGVIGLFVLPIAADGGGPSQKDVLARAGRRVVQYQAELPHLIATETSVQRATAPRGRLVEVQERRLVSELGWVSAGTMPDLVGVRDVVEVDGQPLHGGERLRLQMLLHGSGPTTPASVTQLLNEGARFNLSAGSRNFNLPTIALFFLHPETQSRFKWSRQSPSSGAIWVMRFKERERPTIIRTDDGESIFCSGFVEIEAATGEVRRTELTLHVPRARVPKGSPRQEDDDHPEVDYTLTTTFGRVASMDMNLPVSLAEKYVTPTGIITGEARYDSYKRFDTSARMVQ